MTLPDVAHSGSRYRHPPRTQLARHPILAEEGLVERETQDRVFNLRCDPGACDTLLPGYHGSFPPQGG